jgi:GTP-sensing pleiotropic transcriptional regulator CodY
VLKEDGILLAEELSYKSVCCDNKEIERTKNLSMQVWQIFKYAALTSVSTGEWQSPVDTIGHIILELIDRENSIYAAQIAQRLMITRAAVTKRLRSLTKQGFVTICSDEENGLALHRSLITRQPI